MTPKIKLFFDICLSPKLPRILQNVYSEDCEHGLETAHLKEWFVDKPDIDDSVWIPMLAKKRGWIAITADKGKDPKTEKLPVLCAKHKVTHISMSATVHEAGYFVHKHAILTLFPQIRRCFDLEPGTKVRLNFTQWHRRNWSNLTINGKAFDLWCFENNVLTQPEFEIGKEKKSN